jgi:hypothetical protein
MTTNQLLKSLKKQIEKDWGEKCGEYVPLCPCCTIWRAFDDICILYRSDVHSGKKLREVKFNAKEI